MEGRKYWKPCSKEQIFKSMKHLIKNQKFKKSAVKKVGKKRFLSIPISLVFRKNTEIKSMCFCIFI